MSLPKFLKLLPGPFRATHHLITASRWQNTAAAGAVKHLAGVQITVSDEGKRLQAVWNADKSTAQPSTYHAVWLRHNCNCPQCLPEQNQKTVVSHELDPNVVISEARIAGN